MNPDNNMGNSYGSKSMGYSSLGSMPNNTINNNPENVNNQNLNNYQGFSSVGPIGNQGVDSMEGMTLNSAINNYTQGQSINPEPVITPETVQPTVNSNVVSQPYVPGLNTQSAAQDVGPTIQPSVEAPTNSPVLQPAQPVETLDAPTEPQAPTVSGPTMPIPDEMPDLGYQANVSTPVDYATPVSDFDEIGVTPELDPKAKQKGNKKGGKTLSFVLVILAILALGAGSYYFINVKGILNKSSVVTKNLTVEQGMILSDDINDYATFKNISSANCVQDLSGVDIFTAGTYEYTIKCGKDVYKGTITIQDTKAPTVVLQTSVITKDQIANLTAESFVKTCSEISCTYAFEEGTDLTSLVTEKGIYPVKIKVSDEGGNSSTVTAPLIVTDESLHVGLLALKEILSNDEYTLTEKVVVLYSDLTSLSYTMYKFTFKDEMVYSTYANKSAESDQITIGDYTGYPMYNQDNMSVTLVTSNSNNLIQGSYALDRQALLNVGYNTEVFASDHLSVIDN